VIRGSIIRKEFTGTGEDFDFRHPGCAQPPAAPPNALEVRALGSGGVALRWRDDVLLLGPYFSRPGSVVAAQFGRVRFDFDRIRRGMAPFADARVRAVIVGHSHFDHMADVPMVVKLHAPDAPVYANQTGVNMLRPYVDAKAVRPNEWTRIPNAPFRFLAIESAHAPQLCGLNHWPCTYAMGEVDEPWSTPWTERHYRDLRCGQTHAFVIEVLNDDDTMRCRIYYNDSAAQPPKGLPPPELAPFDLAVVCMASYHFIHDYPERLLERAKPRHVVISHWDDFFEVQDGAWTFVPLLTDDRANEFMRRMRDALDNIFNAAAPHPPLPPVCGPSTERWSMPVPGWPLYFGL
jgi:L-ascorbate metabolism protein UlaG (beta-lactamase superfamily)